MESAGTKKEPMPTVNDNPRAVDLVIGDLESAYANSEYLNHLKDDLLARAEVGFNTYKDYLRPFNGRSAVVDLYQELLDASKYMRVYLYEHKSDEDKTRYNRMSAAYSSIIVLMFNICKEYYGEVHG